MNEWEINLSLQKPMFQKIIKNDVNATADVWQNRGGPQFRKSILARTCELFCDFGFKSIVFFMVAHFTQVSTGTEPHEER